MTGVYVQTKISKLYLNKSGKTEEVVKEETLAMRTAKHISDMWSEASKKGEVKSEEEDDEKKEDGKTMTGKPMSKVDTKVKEGLIMRHLVELTKINEANFHRFIVSMDMVLCDFIGGYEKLTGLQFAKTDKDERWNAITGKRDFWATLDWM